MSGSSTSTSPSSASASSPASSGKAQTLSKPSTQLRHAWSEDSRTPTQTELSKQTTADIPWLDEVDQDENAQSDDDVSPPDSVLPTPEMGNIHLPDEDHSSPQEQSKPGVFSDADLERVVEELNVPQRPYP